MVCERWIDRLLVWQMGQWWTSNKLYCQQECSSFLAEFFGTNGWNSHCLAHLLPQNMVIQISQIPMCQGAKDVMIWVPSSNGQFSISSAWHAI